MHMFWPLEGAYAAVEVTLEVLEPPSVDRLYFWALQATFTDGRRDLGGAHLGLQWHPDYPGATAVNWGGYRHGGGELPGTTSALPSTLGNPHTRDFAWAPTLPYRLRIERSAQQAGSWQGSVRDPRTGEVVVVRHLHAGGTHLRSLMTWSEVFARCDHPPVTVRWSDPVAYDDAGQACRPVTVTLNYQARHDGGCTNTNSFVDGVGVCQRTASTRANPQGARLRLP